MVGSLGTTLWTRLHQQQQCASAYIDSVSASINEGDRELRQSSDLCANESRHLPPWIEAHTYEALRRDVNQQW
jgi:hypothetical protein